MQTPMLSGGLQQAQPGVAANQAPGTVPVPAQVAAASTPYPGVTEMSVAHTRIADWLRLFVVPGEVVEIRVIHTGGKILAGYFSHKNLETAARVAHELSVLSSPKGVYFTFNPLQPELLARSPNKLSEAPGRLTTDRDIITRRWLFVDVDPVRPASSSATDAEKSMARAKALAIREYLATLEWPDPLMADSGNGYHLLYRVQLPADDGGLVKRVLVALAAIFDDATVKIDTVVHNASRITKLYGTKACKGPDTPDRPHRWTAIIDEPAEVKVVPRELLEALAGTAKPAANASKTVAVGSTAQAPVPRAARRAHAYLAAMDPAIEGQGGDRQTYRAACALVWLFGLKTEAALPLLREWNETHCDPSWDEARLRHKLERARLDPRPGRSFLEERPNLTEPRRGRRQEPEPGVTRTRYCGVVRDLGMVDEDVAEFINAVGDVKRPFASLSSWPLLSPPAAQLPDPDTDPAGPVVEVDTVAARPGGVVWRTPHSDDWAIRLLPATPRDQIYGLAFCRRGSQWLLDGGPRVRHRDTEDERGIPPDSMSPGDARSRLAVLGRKIPAKGIEQALWYLLTRVLDQRSARVVLPDVALAQIVWGPDRQDWPRRWRRRVFDLLSALTVLRLVRVTLEGGRLEVEPGMCDDAVFVRSVAELAGGTSAAVCSKSCPLWESRTRHHHLGAIVGRALLGNLLHFRVGCDDDGEAVFDFRPDLGARLEAARTRAKALGDVGPTKLKHLIERKEERATAEYRALFEGIVTVPLALQVFGDRVGLSPHQRRCLRVLVREVTRAPRGRKQARGDRAQVFAGNRVPGRRQQVAACDILDPVADHVVFGGNGLCWGTGYLIWTWMGRMGYRAPCDTRGKVRVMRRFLRDMSRLCGLMDVTFVGHLDGEWYSPEWMLEQTRTREGRRRLNRTSARFYTRADYLQRWRGMLEPGLGLRDATGVSSSKDTRELDLWLRMERVGMTQKELAALLGKSPGFVSKLRSGKKQWPQKLRETAEEVVRARVGESPLA